MITAAIEAALSPPRRDPTGPAPGRRRTREGKRRPAMTIDELIELAQDARERLGGDAQVRIAYQPGYPCAPRSAT